MDLRYGYVGSTDVSKTILKQAPVEPEVVISLSNSHRNKISGFTTYEEYNSWVQVESINSDNTKEILRAHNLDILLVMAWPELFDKDVLSIPEVGCVGRHLSLLPKRRGRAPVAWALIHGITETGVTLFWLDQGVDTGDIIDQCVVQIEHDDEADDLHEKMTETTVDLLSDVLPTFEEGVFPRTPQDDSMATYTHPRRPDMGLIDWEKSASCLYDFIRAQTHPYPGAFTYHRMDKVTVWHAIIEHRTTTRGQPGEVLSVIDAEDETYLVQTGEGILRIDTENKHRNHPVQEGNVLGCLR